MAVTISGATSQNGSVANYEFSTTGFDDGDVIYMGVAVEGDVSGSIAPDEAGWTSIISQVYETGSAGTLYVWRRVLSGSPPATYGVTWTGSVNSAGFCLALAGVDTGTPEDFTPTYNEGNSTSPVNTAGTTTVDNVFLLYVMGLARNDRVDVLSGTTPAWTEGVDRGNGSAGGGTSIVVDYGTLASAGSTGTHTITGVGSADEWGVALIGVRPTTAVHGSTSPATVNAVAAVPSVTTTGGGATSPATVSAVTAIPTPTVTESIEVTPATVNVVASVSTPTVSGGSTVSPSTVTALAAVPSVSVSGGGAVVAVSVDAVAAIPTPAEITAGSTVSPASVDALAGVPAVTLAASSTITVVPVDAVVSIPTATPGAGANVSPATVAITVSINLPFVSPALFGPYYATVLDSGRATASVLDSGESTAPQVSTTDTFLTVLDDGRSTSDPLDDGSSTTNVLDPGSSSATVLDQGGSP